jgi:hypothetical protein
LPVTTVLHEIGEQGLNTLGINPVDDRTTVALCLQQARPGQNCDMARERVVTYAEIIRNFSCGKAGWTVLDQQSEDSKPRGLCEGRKSIDRR